MPLLARVKIIFSPAALVISAAVGVAVMTWLGGAIFGLDPLLQWLVSFLVPIAGLVFAAYLRGHRRAREAQLQPLIADDDEQRAALIKASIASGVRAIQRARGNTENSKRGLDKLPWFLVIGETSSGKTQLLRNSGLSFPHDDPQSILNRGVEGTSGCDWWLTESAAFIDTSGRLSDNSESRTEWLALLQQLRYWRSRKPLDGVLLTVSIGDILRSDNEALQRKAWLIRERLDDMRRNLRSRVPVFLVFTQADQIRGFAAFFAGLSSEQSNQPWGVELDGCALSLADQISRLINKLAALRLAQVASQHDLSGRVQAFEFPQQFRRISDKFNNFVEALTRTDYYRRSPRLEGVYLTSSRAVSQALESRANSRSQGYFIKGLLTQRVIPLAERECPEQHRLLMQQGLKWLVAGGALVLVTIALSGFAGSAQDEMQIAERTGISISAAQTVLNNPSSTDKERFESLEGLYDNWLQLRQRSHLPLWSRVVDIDTSGLQLSKLEPLMGKLVSEAVLREAIVDLSAALNSYNQKWGSLARVDQEVLRPEYYRALAVYRMLTTDPDRLDPEIAGRVLASYWLRDQHHRLSDSQVQAITHSLRLVLALADSTTAVVQRGHVRGLGGRLPQDQSSLLVARLPASGETDYELIERSRQDLTLQQDAQGIYQRVLAKAASSLPALTLDDLLSGRDRELLRASKTGGEISGAFAGGAWDGFIEEHVERLLSADNQTDWVIAELGGEQTSAYIVTDEIIDKVAALYIEDMVTAWLDFIASLRPAGFNSLHDSTRRLDRLAGTEGALAALFASIRRHLAQHSGNQMLEQAAPAVGLSKVGRLYSDRRGSELFALLSVDEDKLGLPRLLLGYSQSLRDLQGETESLAFSADQGRDSAAYAANILTGKGGESPLQAAFLAIDRTLASSAHELRTALQPLLKAPLQYSWEQILGASRDHINGRWREDAVGVYRASLIGRFPFSSGGRDAAIGDFEGFFRGGDGVLWRFVEEHLEPFVERRGGRWREKSWHGEGLGIQPSFLAMMDKGEAITNSLFGGLGHLNLSFSVAAQPNPDLVDMRMDVNGAGLRYRNEPERWQSFSWSGEGGYGARVAATSGITGGSAQLRASGDWALLRLLQGADRIHAENSAEFIAEWDLHKGADTEHRPFSVHIRTERSAPVLTWRKWDQFNLPDRVTF